jgi:hypothetical protein
MTKIQRTGWGPDTCGCYTFEYWDSDLPVEDRTYWSQEVEPFLLHGEPHVGTTRCEAHKDHKDAHEHFLILKEENDRKNITHGEVGVEKNIIWEWSGKSPNRTLHVFHKDKKIKEVKKQQQ